MLETVARSAADQYDVAACRVAVDQEVAVRTILILAYLGRCEGRGVKFANDDHGAEVDPDTQSRVPTDAALAEIVAFRDRRFPLLRGAPLTEARVCQYENSSNGDFLIDRLPDMANVVLVGGGSGHGFKHGPEVGRAAAALVLSGTARAEPRLSLATKATTQKREVH